MKQTACRLKISANHTIPAISKNPKKITPQALEDQQWEETNLTARSTPRYNHSPSTQSSADKSSHQKHLTQTKRSSQDSIALMARLSRKIINPKQNNDVNHQVTKEHHVALSLFNCSCPPSSTYHASTAILLYLYLSLCFLFPCLSSMPPCSHAHTHSSRSKAVVRQASAPTCRSQHLI